MQTMPTTTDRLKPGYSDC